MARAKMKYDLKDKIVRFLSINDLKDPGKIIDYIQEFQKEKKKGILIPDIYGDPKLYKKLYGVSIERSKKDLSLKDIEKVSCVGADIILKYLKLIKLKSKKDYDIILSLIIEEIKKKMHINKVIPSCWIEDEEFKTDLHKALK